MPGLVCIDKINYQDKRSNIYKYDKKLVNKAKYYLIKNLNNKTSSNDLGIAVFNKIVKGKSFNDEFSKLINLVEKM